MQEAGPGTAQMNNTEKSRQRYAVKQVIKARQFGRPPAKPAPKSVSKKTHSV
jgi:hypothetical protein